MWASIEDIERRQGPSLYNVAKEFSLSVQDQGAADQTKWTLCLSLLGQGRLVAAGYRSKHPDRCLILTPDHCRHRRMLADICLCETPRTES